jgi:CRISPR system Cascade subunit CasD
LREVDDPPTLDNLAAALAEPARPLFLGRKPCLPSRPIVGGFVDAADPLAAVLAAERPEGSEGHDPGIVVRERPGLPESWERLFVTDERIWISGVHAGERIFRRGPASRLASVLIRPEVAALSGGVFEGWLSVEGTDFLRVVLQLAHG